ncbi:MAG: response regulator transcription factor [bacterium]|nr:response regulator transcription factor [bacterium]
MKIFIIDSHPVVCDGLRQLLKREKDLAVCGEAGSISDALAAIGKKSPDIIIADSCLGGEICGIELTKNIRKHFPALPILVVSMFAERCYVERVMKAGANGYMAKNKMTREIITAIRRILANEVFVGRDEESSRFEVRSLRFFPRGRLRKTGKS